MYLGYILSINSSQILCTSHLPTYPASRYLSFSISLKYTGKIAKQTKMRKLEKNKLPKQKTHVRTHTYEHTHKNHGVHSVMVSCSWTWYLPWNMVDMPSDTESAQFPIKKKPLMVTSFLIRSGTSCWLPLTASREPIPDTTKMAKNLHRSWT